MVNGRPDEGKDMRLGNEIIDRVASYKYLGVTFDENGADRAKNNRICRANQWWGRLCSIAKCRANKYEVVRGMWKNMVIPSILHGMGTINWTAAEIKRMEIIQNKVGRLALGSNKSAGVEAIRGDMGWSTFEERLMKSQLNYKVRLEKMNEGRWAKKISMVVGDKSKWVKNCAKAVDSVELFKSWGRNQEGIYEWRLAYTLGDTSVYDIKKWKTFINERVQKYGLKKWRDGIDDKTSLERYGKKKCPKTEMYYDGSWRSSLLFKARSGSLETNVRTYRYNERGNKECEYGCRSEGVVMDETIFHIMAECNGNSEYMEWAIQNYVRILGREKFLEILGTGEENIDFFLGLEEDVPMEVMEITKIYLGMIWSARKEKMLSNQQTEVTYV